MKPLFNTDLNQPLSIGDFSTSGSSKNYINPMQSAVEPKTQNESNVFRNVAAGVLTGGSAGGVPGAVAGGAVELLKFGTQYYFGKKAEEQRLKTLMQERKRSDAKELIAQKEERRRYEIQLDAQRRGLNLSEEQIRFAMDREKKSDRFNRFQAMLNGTYQRIQNNAALKEQFIKRGWV